MNDKENQGLTFHISPNQTFLCDINIDSISKDITSTMEVAEKRYEKQSP